MKQKIKEGGDMKITLTAAAVVDDFNRRKIQPDWIDKVAQGYLRRWRINQNIIAELWIGSDNGKRKSGMIILLSPYAYINILSPQEIADDIKLHNGNIEILNPVDMGRKGGSSKSPAKQKSSRENGKLGGRPITKK